MSAPWVFISFAPDDEDLCRELEEHIALLKQDGAISGWHRYHPQQGWDLQRETSERLGSAGVVILLMSPHYATSNLTQREAKYAIERARAGAALVIPVLLRGDDGILDPIPDLSPLPRKLRPVTNWSNRDQAWAHVATEIREAIAALDARKDVDQLEQAQDWEGLAVELETRCRKETDAATKAAYHLRLGHVYEDKLLQIVRALKCYQDGYKLNIRKSEPLHLARSIYWDLGKIPMVRKLLEIELANVQQQPEAAAGLLIELGDVLADLGDHRKAAESYSSAAASNSHLEQSRALYRDVEVGEGDWQTLVQILDAKATGEPEPAAKARILLRAARVAKRFASMQVEALLEAAYVADPANKEAAALYEELLVEQGRAADILKTQRRVLDGLSGKERGRVAFRYGARWAVRHQNPKVGEPLMKEALTHDPWNEAAFIFLRDLHGTKEGNWRHVANLVEAAASASETSPFMLAQAGLVTWRRCNDVARAAGWFQQLEAVAPDHPALRAFEAAK